MKFCPNCASQLIKQEIDGAYKNVCVSDGCDFVNWNNPVPVVAGLVQLGNNYVLARNSEWPKEVFSVITGFMEKNETPEESISRELKEELGYACMSLKFIGHFKFPKNNQLIIAYHLEAKGALSLSTEIAEIKVVSREALFQYDFGKFQLTSEIISSWARSENAHNNTP
ncbi:MAG: NUDIX domain-containing protein [Gammaproteobacteria bacterium]|nr:NUDIX domain-containing protein [Gammaproteobacteria bacterium]